MGITENDPHVMYERQELRKTALAPKVVPTRHEVVEAAARYFERLLLWYWEQAIYGVASDHFEEYFDPDAALSRLRQIATGMDREDLLDSASIACHRFTPHVTGIRTVDRVAARLFARDRDIRGLLSSAVTQYDQNHDVKSFCEKLMQILNTISDSAQPVEITTLMAELGCK